MHRIRCGKQSPYTDSFGQVWAADQYYASGTKARSVAKSDINTSALVSTNEIENGIARRSVRQNLPSTLFHYERVTSIHSDSSVLFYSLPVPIGFYVAKLYFAETSPVPVGARRFGVEVNNEIYISEIDIAKEVGINVALGKIIPGIAAPGGRVNISLVRLKGNPKISGIELFTGKERSQQTSSISVPVTNARIRAGHPADVTDDQGRVWFGDTFFDALNSKSRSVPSAPLDVSRSLWPIFYYERYASAKSTSSIFYSVPVVPGFFSITLYFAETSYVAEGSRVFDVAINNETRIYSLDIAREAGIGKVLIRALHNVSVFNSLLQIALVRHNGNPKLSAFELARTGELPVLSAGSSESTFSLRLRCGNSQASIVDSLGYIWQPDKHFVASNTKARPVKKSPIANASTELWPLYYYERYSSSPVAAPTFYEIPVPNGTYVVSLHFTETSSLAPGQRVFDVAINSHRYVRDVDIIAAVGLGILLKLVIPYVAVSSGILRIDLPRVTGNPKINALEITTFASTILASPTPLTSLYLNCGSRTGMKVGNQTWIADTDYMSDSSQSRAVAHVSLNGIDKDWWPLFYSERYISSPRTNMSQTVDLLYRIPVSEGNYNLTLFFAEIYFNVAQPRIFDVLINGITVIPRLNVHGEVGLFAVLQRTVTVTPVDGVILIAVRSIAGKPKINALQIVPATNQS